MKTKDIINISLFATLLAICAWICIPMAVPFTMQTFAVFLAMLVLGGKQGTIVILIYLMLGLIGIPVFAGGTTGVGVLFGPTGGYMIGWIFLGLITWRVDRIRIPVLFLGLLTCYFFGTLWYMKVYASSAENIGFLTAFSVCVVPFIIPDIIKMFLAVTVSKRIKKVIRMFSFSLFSYTIINSIM